MARHIVAPVGDLPPGSRKLVTVNGRPIAIFNVEGDFYAILNRCPHQGGSLVQGYLTGRLTSSCPGDYDYQSRRDVIRCPWHAWEFDLRTGLSQCEPDRIKVRKFPLSVAAGDALLEQPLVAETFPVDVEGSYLVLEM